MRAKVFVLPLVCGLVLLGAWWAAHAAGMFPTGTVPSPPEVGRAFIGEIKNGRLLDDVISSLYRVAWGFVTAVIARLGRLS